MKIRTSAMGVVLASLSLAFFASPAVRAQTHPVPARITAIVDDTRTVQLKGNVHPLARPEFDRGAVADSQPMTRMLLTLQRSAEQETALAQLMDSQQTKGSANYHAWLTPEQFGKQFGPSDADVQAVTDWLTRQGFQVAKVAAGRNAIEFSGNVAQVRNAFHTEIHKFVVNGEEHFANVSDPAIPAALAPVVGGVASLHNFRKRSFLREAGHFERTKKTGELKALDTFTGCGTGGGQPCYAVGPGDFATIYNTNPLFGNGIKGTGVKIAIVARSSVNPQDVQNFWTGFGVTNTFTASNIILNGPDPGLIGPNSQTNDELEADLDVQWAGAVAPGAQVLLVVSESTSTTVAADGVDLSALYIVDNNLADVMSESFGSCELANGATGNQLQFQLWEQAAAQGITVMVSSGDSGSAGCDGGTSAQAGLQISGTASTPFNVAVGGTDFADAGNQTTFWNTSGLASAKGYVPETAWNSSCAATGSLTGCTNPLNSQGRDLAAAGGGPSSCVDGDTLHLSSCTQGWAQPPWQVGFITDTVRNIPDVSLFAAVSSSSQSFALVCQSDANPGNAPCNANSAQTLSGVGGTSVASPSFAGIMALVVQKTGQRQGNANYVLYALANAQDYTKCNSTGAGGPDPNLCVFNDITTGNISVACAGHSQNCSNKTSGTTQFGILVDSTNQPAWKAGAKYDRATGLGSVNATNLVTKWATAFSALTLSKTTLGAPNPATAINLGANFSIPITVAPNAGGGTPTGDVSLIAVPGGGGLTQTFGPFTLDGTGKVTASTSFLPGGNAYNLTAHYGGDATFGPSDSTPVQVTVNKATSKTVLNFVTAAGTPTQAPQNIPYGSPYILNVEVSNSSGALCTDSSATFPCPTGNITMTDGGQQLKDFTLNTQTGATNIASLNNGGFLEDQFIQLNAGAHTIVASYTGDNNFTPSPAASNTLSVTITPATTTTLVASSLGVVPAGTHVTLTAVVGSTSNSSQGPTGTIQFQSGSTNIGAPVTCAPSGANAVAGASCTATLPNAAISALFPPPTGGPRPTLPLLPTLFALLSIVLFALGRRWTPDKRRRTYAYAGFVAFALLAVAIAGCGGGGGGGGGHTVTIKANYLGDTNYAASTGSTTITIQ